MEWRVGARISVDLVQRDGRRFAGCWVGFDLIWLAMMGRRWVRTRVSISWMPRRYPVLGFGQPWMAMVSS